MKNWLVGLLKAYGIAVGENSSRKIPLYDIHCGIKTKIKLIAIIKYGGINIGTKCFEHSVNLIFFSRRTPLSKVS